MYSKLNTLGVPNEYHEYFLDGHGFNPTNTNDAINRTVIFSKSFTVMLVFELSKKG
jgi:hypothetical protein